MEPRRVLLVDRFDLFRRGLRRMLEGEGLWVVGEAGTGREGLALIEDLKPHIAIVEPDVPDMGGAEAVRQMGERSPRTRIIILALVTSDEDAESARRLGAACLPKHCHPDDFLDALRAAST